MPKFEDKFVHFRWSDELEGKSVFYADDIHTLIKDVKSGYDIAIVEESGMLDAPFEVNGNSWSFVYYDPHYDLKLAYEQGKTIQVKHILTGEWEDMTDTNIDWDNVDGYELRIKPEESKPVTNRELARWLAQGNGECKKYDGDIFFSTDHCYWSGEENTPAIILVRKWEDEEWNEPTREYMGL